MESRERGSSPERKPNKTGGLGEHSKGLRWKQYQETVNSGVPKLQYCTRVSITNDKQARELHELAQYLRKIPIKYQLNGE